jgi:hypothetical protein
VNDDDDDDDEWVERETERERQRERQRDRETERDRESSFNCPTSQSKYDWIGSSHPSTSTQHVYYSSILPIFLSLSLFPPFSHSGLFLFPSNSYSLVLSPLFIGWDGIPEDLSQFLLLFCMMMMMVMTMKRIHPHPTHTRTHQTDRDRQSVAHILNIDVPFVALLQKPSLDP